MNKFMSVDLGDARTIADSILKRVAHEGLPPVCIVIGDTAGTPLVLFTMDGCPPASVTLALAKAYTVSRVQKNTRYGEGFDPANWADSRITSFGGGTMILSPLDGSFVGCIGVSGCTQEQDYMLASSRPSGWYRG